MIKQKTYNCYECGDEYPIPSDFTGEPTICYSCAQGETDKHEQYEEDREADRERSEASQEAHELSVMSNYEE